MVDQRVTKYIQQNLSRGTPIEKIKEELIKAGWKQEVVNEAISHSSPATPERKQKAPPEKKSKISKKIIYGAIVLFLLLGISIALFALTNQ